MTRQLAEQFAVGALRRGAQIEQFLGATSSSGPAGVAWVVVSPRQGRLVVILHEAALLKDGARRMLEHHPDLDDGERSAKGRELGLRDDPIEAMALAEEITGATRDRWVNAFMVDDEYYDWLDAGCPSMH